MPPPQPGPIHAQLFASGPDLPWEAIHRVHVGAIHGRLLTAWSLAGVAGPVLVKYLREYEIAHGVAARDAYAITMYVMAALLVVVKAAQAVEIVIWLEASAWPVLNCTAIR